MADFNYKIAEGIGGRKEQQDFAGASETKFGLLVVVCDGMGGAKGGATASRMAVNAIMHTVLNASSNSPASVLLEAFQRANAEIFRHSRMDENCRGMGTTGTAILLQKEKATVAHVGDSRIYQLRNPELFAKGMQKIFRTNDHSKVFELVKRGIMNEEQARVSDESNVILRALGLRPEVEVEIKDNLPYLKGDRFLLCTDGICGAVPEITLLTLLYQNTDVNNTVNKLVSTIDKIGYNSGGGHDNMTAALIECKNNSILKPQINMNTKITIASLAVLLALSLGYISYDKLSPSVKINPELETAVLRLRQDSLQQITINESLKKEIVTLKANNEKLDSVLKIRKDEVSSVNNQRNNSSINSVSTKKKTAPQTTPVVSTQDNTNQDLQSTIDEKNNAAE
jgi:serine/threonine protein phosphatase PrpC